MNAPSGMHVVFLPGSLCDGRVFADQIAAVIDAGHYCSVVDLRSQTSIEHMAGLVVATSQSGVILVGLSLGGIVAAEVVAKYPDHVGAVAVFDTNLAPPDQNQLRTRRRWAQQARSGEFASFVAAELIEPLTTAPDRNGELIFDMAMDCGAKGFLRQNEALLHRRDRRNDLAGFARPVLIGWGEHDAVCPPSIHHELADRTPLAERIEVPQAGHLATIDRPTETTERLIDWLDRCSSTIQTQEGNHEYQDA